MVYVEPFFGAGAVFFRKEPGKVETVNDINGDIYNLFKQIRDNGEELARLIEYTPWSRRDYEESYIRSGRGIEDARRFLVRCRFSIGSRNNCRTGWRNNHKDENGDIGLFDSLPPLIQKASNRLKPKRGNVVQIENRDALFLIEKYNNKNVLMYLDPPYVLETRKNRKPYKHEMTNEDHVRLCELINKSEAKIVVSGYENGIYAEHLKRFYKTGIKAYDERGNAKTEVIWTNYRTPGELFEYTEIFSDEGEAV
jgi:DNA adenine methylase